MIGVRNRVRPNSDSWWYQCRAVYNKNVIETKLRRQMPENGELGVTTDDISIET